MSARRSPQAPRVAASRAPRVVGVGLCVADRSFEVEDFHLAAERVRYRAEAAGPGGMVTTALAQAARLGCRAALLSVVGDDREGAALLRQVRGLGVSTRGVRRDPVHATTTSVVLVERGTGARRFLVPDRRRLERQAARLDLRPVERAHVLLVDGHFARDALAAVRRARARGIPVVADFCDARPAHRRLLPWVSHPIVPEAFVRHWGVGGVHATLRALARETGGTPVVTRGARGASALVAGRVVHVPARRVRVRDTTGAGDAFHGAFAAGLARGLDVRRALALASAAAAVACTGLGGAARLAGEQELGRWLARPTPR